MRRNARRGRVLVRFVMLALGMLVPALVLAQAATAYWISMRGMGHDAQPSFVTVSPMSTATHTVSFTGCRGVVWWLEPSGFTFVQAARAAGETLQIHRGAAGSAPDRSTVICLIQADG